MRNYRMIGFVVGRVFLVEAAALLFPLAVGLMYREHQTLSFLIPILLLLGLGLLLSLKTPQDRAIYARDGLAAVAFSWIFLSAFGALPFFLSGAIPDYIDCFFEAVSGFTTTGASILTDVEAMSKGLLFWRSFTHWLGGMGVLVFVMTILPTANDGHSMHLMRAEVPGPVVGKLVSKMKTSAKILYGIYAVMTLLEIGLLLAGGMSFYDACINSFGSAGTGGFSHYALSIGHYNNLYFEIVIGVFMLLFGVNFNLYYFLLVGKVREVLRSEELRVYLGIVGASVLMIAANIASHFGSFWTGLRYSFFQVASIITTTGYSTCDFNLWPAFSRAILVILMFIGGCAGSTAGGLKVARVAILFKGAIRDMKKMLHPNAVSSVRFDRKPLDEKTMHGVNVYFVTFALVFTVIFALLCLDCNDLLTNFTALAATINNIGPGLGAVGPMGSFAVYSPLSTLLLSFAMLLGRLEIFPILLLLAPSMWSRRAFRKK